MPRNKGTPKDEPPRKGTPVVFWLNKEKPDHAFTLEILDWYKGNNSNASEVIRRGIRIAYYLDTGDIEALLKEPHLPDSIRRGIRIAYSIETDNTAALLRELPMSLNLSPRLTTQPPAVVPIPQLDVPEGNIEIEEIDKDDLLTDTSNHYDDLF